MRRPLRNPAPAGVPKRFGFRRRLRASRQRSRDSAAASNQRAQPAPERVEPPVARARPEPIAPPDLDQLEAEERYHRERLALYRARSYGSRPTSPARLRELGRIWEAAKARLTHARSQRP
jgi:uncharacterized protein with von Willebrand factor type A (vWA) domain